MENDKLRHNLIMFITNKNTVNLSKKSICHILQLNFQRKPHFINESFRKFLFSNIKFSHFTPNFDTIKHKQSNYLP